MGRAAYAQRASAASLAPADAGTAQRHSESESEDLLGRCAESVAVEWI